MWDETCRICGQPYAHLFGCPLKQSDRSGGCPDTFPADWLGPDQDRTIADHQEGTFRD
jgi:hypothetical protein